MSEDERLRADVGSWSVKVFAAIRDLQEAVQAIAADAEDFKQQVASHVEQQRDRMLRLEDVVASLSERVAASAPDVEPARDPSAASR